MSEGEGREGDQKNGVFPWYLGVFDAHCHPTDTMSSVEEIPKMKARVLTIMATRSQDQHLVAEVADRIGLTKDSAAFSDDCEQAPCQVIPSFGWHPWFSHHLFDDESNDVSLSRTKIEHYKSVLTPSPDDEEFVAGLPDPHSLSVYLNQTRNYLLQYPLALVGEIGLDRSFRIPETSPLSRAVELEPGQTPGSRNGKRLSPYRVEMGHQRRILKAQLGLAGEMQRAVSLHGVAAHGILFETLQEMWKGHEKTVISSRLRKRRGSVQGAHDHEEDEDDKGPGQASTESKPFPPRVCLHSYSGPPETLRQYFSPFIPAVIFFSFSQAINFSTPASKKTVEVIKAVPADRILVESDVHRAGERMDQLLMEVAETICDIKNWGRVEGVRKLAQNWKNFALGAS